MQPSPQTPPAKLNLFRVPSSACPTGCGAEDGTEHLLCRCPAYALARHAVFGEANPPLTALQSAPRDVVRYLQRIGRASGSRYPVVAVFPHHLSCT